jgi:hypothetical protein
MAIPEDRQKNIDILIKAIQNAIKEIDPNMQIKDEKIAGLIIIQFPADHNKTGSLVTTAIGKVCINHTLEFLAELKSTIQIGEQDYVS